MSDRTVHAALVEPRLKTEIVRYDRQGRWYVEYDGAASQRKVRIPSVHDAAQMAIDLEADGGTIYTGRPGGQQFDTKVAGARQRRARGVKR